MSGLLWPDLEPEAQADGWLAVPKAESRMTSAQVLDALGARHPMDGYVGPGRWVFVREVQAATGHYSDVQRFDALAVGLVPSVKYARVVYEVKVSRADWLRELRPVVELHAGWGYRRRIRPSVAAEFRDASLMPGEKIVEFAKWQAALDLSTELWFAAPPFVILPDEVPPEAGLVEVRPWGPERQPRARVVVKAPVRETPNPGPEFWASVLRRAATR